MKEKELIENLGGEHETMVAACKLFARILNGVALNTNATEITFKVGEITDKESGKNLGRIKVIWESNES